MFPKKEVLDCSPFFLFVFSCPRQQMNETPREVLLAAIKLGDFDAVQFILNVGFLDFNDALDDDGWTPLHYACAYGHREIVSELILRFEINVNQKSKNGTTPFHITCSQGNIETLKVLLKDYRVDINMAGEKRRTPLWCVSLNGRVEVIKWMIALRGDELDLDKKRMWGDKEYTPIEIARYGNETKIVSLLERFTSNRLKTRNELRLELGLIDHWPNELFALSVFLCDDFLCIKPQSLGSPASRFFSIVKRLPMELQMILCNRAYEFSKDSIKTKDSEIAFKIVVKMFC